MSPVRITSYGLYAIGFHLGNLEVCLGNIAVGKCVGIIEVFVCRSLLINVNPFYGVEVDDFLLEL